MVKFKKYTEAINTYSKAIENNSLYVLAYEKRAYTYKHNRNYKSAVKDYSRAIFLDPANPSYYVKRGDLYFDYLNDKESGCSDYKKACELGDCESYNFAKKSGDCQ